MSLTLTIASVNRTSKFMLPGTSADVTAALTAGSRGSLRLKVYDILGAAGYRPAIDDALILADGATTIFSGRIDAVDEVALAEPLDTGVVTTITASDWHAFADQTRYSVTYPSGTTLKAILQDLVANPLAPYSITLDAGQATGSTLSAPTTFDKSSPTEILNRLQTETGWVWRIDTAKVLKMIAPASVSCGYSLADGATNTGVFGAVKWKQSRNAQYLNKAIVKIGTEKPVEKTHTMTGNGATSVYTLDYTGVQVNGFILARGYVTEAGVNLPLGKFGVDTATWTYDPATNTLHRASALGVGVVATFQYQAQFPHTVTFENTTESAAHGLYAQDFDAPEVFDKDEGLRLATALVRRGIVTPKIVTVTTNKGIAYPGQSVVLTFAERAISGTFLITAVDVSSEVDGTLRYTLTCLSGTEMTETWLDYYRSTSAGGASSGGTISGGLVPIISGTFGMAVTAWAGLKGTFVDGTARYESRLDVWQNASVLGPAVVLGRDLDAFSWALCAHSQAGASPGSVARLQFVPLQDSSVYRFAMQLTQADVPAAGVYYLTPNAIGALFIGGPTAVFGPGFRVTGVHATDLNLNGQTDAQTGSTTLRALIGQAGGAAINNVSHYYNTTPVSGPQFAFVSQISGMAAAGTASYKVAGYFAGETGARGDDIIPLNVVAQWNAGHVASNVIGIEVDVNNNATDLSLNGTPLVNGVQIASGGSKQPRAAVYIGAAGAQWRKGIEMIAGAVSDTGIEIGGITLGLSGTALFRQLANNGTTLLLQRFTDTAPTGTLLKAINAANSTILFQIDPSGNISMPQASASIELGDNQSANTPFLDFHSSNHAIDYDARIIASGGGAAAGGGTLTFGAAAFNFSSTVTGFHVTTFQNATAGTANGARVHVTADGTTVLQLNKYSSTFTSAGYQQADGAAIVTDGAGGLSIMASHGTTGDVRLYAGGLTERMKLFVNGGVSIGGVASQGAGTLNVQNDVYKNGAAYVNPDYVFEHWATGQIVRFAANAGAAEYTGLLPLAALEAHVRTHFRFPSIGDQPAGAFDRSDIALALIEQNTLYLFDHHARLVDHEDRLRALEHAA